LQLLAQAPSNDSPKFLLLRAEVAEKAQRWQELHDVGDRLLKQYPESETAVRFVSYSAIRLKHFDEAEAVLKPFRDRDPENSWVLRQLSSVYEHRGDYDGAQRILEPLIDRGKPSNSDLNGYAWLSLFTKAGVDKKSLEIGERGLNLSKTFPIMHTVAGQYAEVGRGREGYKLLMQAMDSADLDEPNSEVWYVLARIAESYGETEAAVAMYKKVEGNDEGLYFPTATVLLAQRRSDAINASRPATKSSSVSAGTR
jgi:tetratricopeptide (TPR) repeat protein